MASYTTFIAARVANPDDEFYIENLIFDIPEASAYCNQWNGYELDRVFGIHEKNVADDPTKKKEMLAYLKSFEFWKYNAETQAIADALGQSGFSNQYYKSGQPKIYKAVKTTNKSISATVRIKQWLVSQSSNYVSYKLKHLLRDALSKRQKTDFVGYKKREGNYYYPACSFEFMQSGFLQEKIGEQVKQAFTFQSPLTGRNEEVAQIIKNCESVSVHVRRSDFLKYNSDCYKFGYFKKCAKYIKAHVDSPVWFIFSEDSGWCKENLSVLGLNDKDEVQFIDWNTGTESYRDMQLMSMCKHNVTTKSSFGWWASYLNSNPNKITCAPLGEYTATVHF